MSCIAFYHRLRLQLNSYNTTLPKWAINWPSVDPIWCCKNRKHST